MYYPTSPQRTLPVDCLLNIEHVLVHIKDIYTCFAHQSTLPNDTDLKFIIVNLYRTVSHLSWCNLLV